MFQCVYMYVCVCLVAQLRLTLCDHMDCSLPSSSVHGNSPGKNTAVVTMPSSRGSFQPRDQTWVSHIPHLTGRFFTVWATREASIYRERVSQYSHSVVSDSLWPNKLQLTKLPCPSPTPGAYSNSCPSSQWCHATISSPVIPFPPSCNLSQHHVFSSE